MPQFNIGDRVHHDAINKDGTVVSTEYRQNDEANVYVRWDNWGNGPVGAFTKNLTLLTPVKPVHTLKFQIGDRINHNYSGHGTVVGEPRSATLYDNWCVPVVYDNKNRGFNGYVDGDFESNMTQIPAGIAEVFDAAPRPEQEKITAQLLNELYHDRARLENVVDNATTLMGEVLALSPVVTDKSALVVVGKLKQFIADHE